MKNYSRYLFGRL